MIIAAAIGAVAFLPSVVLNIALACGAPWGAYAMNAQHKVIPPELRKAFIEAAHHYLGKDHTGMDDETQAGELYLDSLAVIPEYRRLGIARQLLMATKERANSMGLPCVGLLVDKGNPAGEALYASVGFRHIDDNMWGGHPMKHLVYY